MVVTRQRRFSIYNYEKKKNTHIKFQGKDLFFTVPKWLVIYCNLTILLCTYRKRQTRIVREQ
jgi:branched-subunit amino acid transport protein AzlD